MTTEQEYNIKNARNIIRDVEQLLITINALVARGEITDREAVELYKGAGKATVSALLTAENCIDKELRKGYDK